CARWSLEIAPFDVW
nr:immunoglobulin heavy chain junction region [Macaca mulatta]MOV48937.1 immunoglobulin heavy chain junction region [Macaca mulatta]MOV49269.1 immunoglobulin heavy chain junction region [Macaca mulatta]MOV49320.1 immunoglobulin heavy chain junction region [Macaca mulatta]MOV49983.1 immunoglobulin heavy chain junction region [Macaca mulatta]